jgi:hypothetical protein
VPVRVFWYPEPSFRAGVEVVAIDDVSVRIYSVEKTIADCFKYRNKIGLDVAIEALRTYRERTPKPNRPKLTKFVEIHRVLKIMRPYGRARRTLRQNFVFQPPHISRAGDSSRAPICSSFSASLCSAVSPSSFARSSTL